jgi:N-glycosylase/DNA lyase
MTASAKQLFDVAHAAYEAAVLQSRVERAESETRIARLRQAKAHLEAGQEEQARAILEELNRTRP